MFIRLSNNPTRDAQLNLEGLTHYVSPENLRFHRSRILEASPVLGGRFYMIRESCTLDWEHTRRGQRCVVFAPDGEMVYHPSLEACGSKTKALRDFDAWLAARRLELTAA